LNHGCHIQKRTVSQDRRVLPQVAEPLSEPIPESDSFAACIGVLVRIADIPRKTRRHAVRAQSAFCDSLKQLSHLHNYGRVDGYYEPETTLKQFQRFTSASFHECKDA
jgi:hypothetical protein